MSDLKIGIDISTRVVAWCCLLNDKPVEIEKDDQRIVMMGETRFVNDGEKSIGMRMFWNDCRSIEALLSPLYWLGRQYNNQHLLSNEPLNIHIVIESPEILNSFANVRTTKKLSLYVGMLLGILYETLESGFYLWLKKENTSIKLISPYEWQKHYPKLIAGEREITKQNSIKFANDYLKENKFSSINSDDLADAINMARVAHLARDSDVVKHKNKTRHKKDFLKMRLNARIARLEHKTKQKKKYNKNKSWVEQLSNTDRVRYDKWTSELDDL